MTGLRHVAQAAAGLAVAMCVQRLRTRDWFAAGRSHGA